MNAMTQNFRLGTKSRQELEGVRSDMGRVVNMAIGISEVDFTVFDGIRSAPEQRALYKRGASQIDGYTRIGKHQKQADGYGHAVDLVPWINGKPVWDWDAIYLIADAMVTSARFLKVPLRWGGCWQTVNDLQGAPENWVAAYVNRKLKAGKRAFNDGPHWELAGGA